MTTRLMTSKRTTVRPFESTVGKSRRKYVGDAIDLADLGCHAFKDGTIPAGRRVLSHNLTQQIKLPKANYQFNQR